MYQWLFGAEWILKSTPDAWICHCWAVQVPPQLHRPCLRQQVRAHNNVLQSVSCVKFMFGSQHVALIPTISSMQVESIMPMQHQTSHNHTVLMCNTAMY